MAKKKKVRVEFKKNRQNRARANNLTRSFRQEDVVIDDGASAERIRAKGDLSRKRTIIQEDGDATSSPEPSSSNLSVDLSQCVSGRVIKVHGLDTVVEAEDGTQYRCSVRRILKTLSIDGRNAVAVGDHVWIRSARDQQGVIERVDARRGTIERSYQHRQHIIASNVDQILIVSAMEEPGLKLPLIDRYLISAEKGGVRPIVILNKADLADLADYQWVVGLYSQLGYEALATSAADGRGLDRLRQIVSRGITAFSGQSGVGKSTLLNAIQPGLNLRVREVSGWTSKGKHTTTHAELIRLEGAAGYVVDTPGLRQFELWGVDPAEVEGYFVEFRPYIPKCKFPDCSHTHESECRVKEAVHWGQIDMGRYESYLKLYAQQPIDGD